MTSTFVRTLLVPCPSCARHVRRSETRCPFCEAALALDHLPLPLLPTRRIGLGAMMAFATLLANGCAASHAIDSGAEADAGIDARILGAADAAYGTADANIDARFLGSTDAAYGTPDAGHDAAIGGCDCGMYGGPPRDAP